MRVQLREDVTQSHFREMTDDIIVFSSLPARSLRGGSPLRRMEKWLRLFLFSIIFAKF